MATLTLYGGGENVSLTSSNITALAKGNDFGAPELRQNRVITIPLRFKDSSADNIQTKIRSVERILRRANLQRRDGRGYPDSFTNELDCYLDFKPNNVTTGGVLPIFKGKLVPGNAWFEHYWGSYVALVTLVLECGPHILGAWTTGTKNAAAWSAMPIAIASGDTGGNSGDDEAPVRFGIQNPAATAYKAVYCAIYPSLGTPIKSNDGVGTGCLVDTGETTGDGTLYNNGYYRTDIDSTTYEKVGSLAITSDGKPRRYVLIIKRRSAASVDLNWRLTIGGTTIVSDVFADDAPPANTWAALVVGPFTWPHLDYIGATDAEGVPTTFNTTLDLECARQSGSGANNVDTDFVAFVPKDSGTYFEVTQSGGIGDWTSAGKPWLHVYNDDGLKRFGNVNVAPGGQITSLHQAPFVCSGDLPVYYPGANKVVAIGVRSDGTIMHSDTLALGWVLRRRYLTL